MDELPAMDRKKSVLNEKEEMDKKCFNSRTETNDVDET